MTALRALFAELRAEFGGRLLALEFAAMLAVLLVGYGLTLLAFLE